MILFSRCVANRVERTLWKSGILFIVWSGGRKCYRSLSIIGGHALFYLVASKVSFSVSLRSGNEIYIEYNLIIRKYYYYVEHAQKIQWILKKIVRMRKQNKTFIIFVHSNCKYWRIAPFQNIVSKKYRISIILEEISILNDSKHLYWKTCRKSEKKILRKSSSHWTKEKNYYCYCQIYII